MYFLLFLFFICFLVFLFSLYVLSRDDYVFLRKNISTEQVFNSAILNILIALFFARLFYVFLNPSLNFLNPLVFLLFPYFPGLSIAGGLMGGIIFLFFYFPKHKMPANRLFDFFLFSFLSVLPIGFLTAELWVLFAEKIKSPLEFLPFLIYTIVFLFFAKVFVPMQKRGEIKGGSLGLLVLISYSIISLFFDIFSKTDKILLFLSKEDFLLILIFLVALFYLNKQEKLIHKI